MNTANVMRAVLICLFSLGFAACNDQAVHEAHEHSGSDGHAHGGHGHQTDAHQQHHQGPEPISLTRFGEKLELFLEYPPLVVGERARFLAHFSVLETGEPVKEGKLIVTLTKPGAEPFELIIDQPSRAGLFIPVLEFGSVSPYRLKLRVEGPQVTGEVEVGELNVHATAEQAANASKAVEEPHDAISFSLEQQWQIQMRLAKAHLVPLSERLRVPATVEPPPGGEVVVSIPLPGRLKRTKAGAFITAGKTVEQGEILAELELPPETASQVKQAKVKLDFARRKFQRVSKIREKGVGSQQQFEQAKEEIELAEAAYRSLLGSSGAVQSFGNDTIDISSDSLSIPIIAPISGEIVSAELQEGSYAAANEELFRVLNSETVWIEARVFEFDIPKLQDPSDAVLELDAYPGQSFSIGKMGGKLVSVGTKVNPSSRSVAVRYELPNEGGGMKFGMFGTVQIATGAPQQRLAIPESAIIYENGVPTAYLLLSAESFQKAILELGVKGERLVEVRRGLQPGNWVVSHGTYAVKLAAITPASFGHGHAH